MSRSNPTQDLPHPCSRWFEWSGGSGIVRYYDKTAKENVEVGSDFTFILLDKLCTIKGWHDASDSGIYSNEVRDQRAETMVVKAFKGGVIAEGLYSQIRDRVNAAGGNFTQNLYIAFKVGNELQIGSIQFKGAALNAWVEFEKANRGELYEKAIRIKGFTEVQKGRITFRMPVFKLVEITPETNEEAKQLDKTLQKFLEFYFKRTRTEQTSTHQEHTSEDYDEQPPENYDQREPNEIHRALDDSDADSQIPF